MDMMTAGQFDERNGAAWFVGTDPKTGQSIVYSRDGKTMAWCCDETMAKLVALLPCLMAACCYTDSFIEKPSTENSKRMIVKNGEVANLLVQTSAELRKTLQKRRVPCPRA